jgi:hypothetical protein
MLLPPFTDNEEVNARHGMSNDGVLASARTLYTRAISACAQGFSSLEFSAILSLKWPFCGRG